MNRVLSSILKNKSRYYMMFKEDHDLHTLKVFGTLAYVSTIQSYKTKLDHRGRKYIFLGFKQGVKGVILLDMNNQDMFISRNVIHYEHIFPYAPNENTIQILPLKDHHKKSHLFPIILYNMMTSLVKNNVPRILTMTIYTCQIILNLTLAILNLTIMILTLLQFIISLTRPLALKIHTDLPEIETLQLISRIMYAVL